MREAAMLNMLNKTLAVAFYIQQLGTEYQGKENR